MVQLLISDANILIDMVSAGLDAAMFELNAEFSVPDILYSEELQHEYGHLPALGLQVVPLDDNLILQVAYLAETCRGPSRNDLVALVLARSCGCPLLTGDRQLRATAETEGVEVHGTLWLIKPMVEDGKITLTAARTAFDVMKGKARRLPWNRVEALLADLAAQGFA